ncbi:MAG: hypothetical protein AMXMBFR13_48670 [Phycisphaerae bacterium]
MPEAPFSTLNDEKVSRAIVSAYHEKLLRSLVSEVVIAGAGPSGLMAAALLAAKGLRVVVVERRLTPGGGVWGGAMAMNEVVIQRAALEVLDTLQVRRREASEGLYTVDSVELAAALTLQALRAGAVILNLTTVEDVRVVENRVCGVVINRSGLSAQLPIDPVVLTARAVIDSTGHDAAVFEMVRRQRVPTSGDAPENPREGPMNAPEGERFVVSRTGQVWPGLWICGMTVCAVHHGPRMGPIFGGMLLSGRRVAELVGHALNSGRGPAAS